MEDHDQIIEKARQAMRNAYAPYSGYHVGACVELEDGTYVPGANVENAAYGSCMCAERNAVYGAYSKGWQKEAIRRLAIVSDGEKLVTPCGACRQVLGELLEPHTPIVLASRNETMVTCIKDLLPFMFDDSSLKK